ncbi:hypothetical protein [Klebsiella aerogenes]|uniref:hypothetical protein n=1 Tax=Klebsiella aerogenes TaxID=548 RepID=UPI001BCFCF85|nr:hypothetical protein [Klebsiella aerogenes]EME5082360.1 hypothetical protein [Klebsiella aerogenes]HDS6469584.1 hypothetical protein [Klebsiella aerogenes]
MFESLKEYFSSTVNTAANRITNPVFGAFAISWCAFNWKSILYLLLSDYGIFDKINYISANSDWKTVIFYPCLSVLVICGGLPWVNNFFSVWQAKPLDNSDSIENQRKAKRILRSTRLQRLQAKHDVKYEMVKTGAEKDIQEMKEEIIRSQNSMGELTAKLNKTNVELHSALDKVTDLSEQLDGLMRDYTTIKNAYNELDEEFEKYKKENPSHTLSSLGSLSKGASLAEFFKDNNINFPTKK